jgi:protein LSM14
LPGSEKKTTENGTNAIDNLTKGVGELKTSENSRRGRGTRGGQRGGRDNTRRIEVPKTDFDFESANAKFNKHDLVKEAIATGSPVGTPTDINGPTEDGPGSKRGSEAGISVPVGVSYNKSSSFFDDISSEIKDRAENKETGQRFGGREFRNEERQKNLETFGQGSVDNYRYGRGRGGRGGRGPARGRGRGYNGRGGNNASRGNKQGPAAVEG